MKCPLARRCHDRDKNRYLTAVGIYESVALIIKSIIDAVRTIKSSLTIETPDDKEDAKGI